MAIRNYQALILLAGLFLRQADAAEFSGYAVLTTDYVFRGVTYSNGNPAAQLAGDISFDSGVFLGPWASTIDINNGADRQRDLEIIYYLGYGRPLSRDWSTSATIVAYTYPGASGSINYDYEELALSVNYADRFWLEYAYSPDLYSTDYETHNIEAYAEFPLAAGFLLGIGFGRYDTSTLTGKTYNYWQAGMSRSIGRIELDLRYHDSSDWVPIIRTPSRAESRLVLSARFYF